MNERLEETPSYRLGTAMSHIAILLGKYGEPSDADREAARAFVKAEDELIQRVLNPERAS